MTATGNTLFQRLRRLAALPALVLGLTTLGVVTATPAVAAAPFNDNIASAAPIPLGNNTTTTLDATLETDEAAAVPTDCGDVDNSVWYTYEADDNNVLKIDTLATAGTDPDLDTVVSVFTSSTPGTPTIASLSPVRCNDQNGVTDENLSSVQFKMTSGTKYFIQLSNYVGPGHGTAEGPVNLNLSKAAAPGNDDIAGSTTLIAGTPATSTTAFSTLEATEGETTPCFDIYDSVWFTWTAGTDTLADVEAIGSSANLSTTVNVYRNTSATIAGLVPVGCGGTDVQFSATNGTTYYVQVSDNGNQAGHGVPGARQVLLSTGTPPTNDDLVAAQAVGSPSTTAIDNTFATVEASEKQPTGSGCSDATRSVWFKYTPSASGTFVAETQATGNPDTTLAVYSGPAAGPTPANLVEVACDDDGGPVRLSRATLPVTAGTTYYIQAGTFAEKGSFQLHLTNSADQPVAVPAAATTTKLTVPKKVAAGKKATIKVAVSTAAGAPVGGTVTVTVKGKATTLTLANGTATFKTGKLKKAGKITVTASYAATSTTLASTATAKIKVKKKPGKH